MGNGKLLPAVLLLLLLHSYCYCYFKLLLYWHCFLCIFVFCSWLL